MEEIQEQLRDIREMLKTLQGQIRTLSVDTANNFTLVEKRIKSKLDEVESSIKGRMS